MEFKQPQLLLQVAQLPALQHLTLHYSGFFSASEAAAATASAWPLLPQLRELVLHADWDYEHAFARVLAGVAAATSLTKLYMQLGCSESWGVAVAVCARLTGLTRLKDLHCCLTGPGPCYTPDDDNVSFALGDALALTVLTRLTRLDMTGAAHGVDTTVATAIAGSLKQLQDLRLPYCCLELSSSKAWLACRQLGTSSS